MRPSRAGGPVWGCRLGRVEGVGGDGGLWGLPESAFPQDSRHQPATGIRSG